MINIETTNNTLVYVTNDLYYVEIMTIQEAIERCFDDPDYVIELPYEYNGDV